MHFHAPPPSVLKWENFRLVKSTQNYFETTHLLTKYVFIVSKLFLFQSVTVLVEHINTEDILNLETIVIVCATMQHFAHTTMSFLTCNSCFGFLPSKYLWGTKKDFFVFELVWSFVECFFFLVHDKLHIERRRRRSSNKTSTTFLQQRR